MVPLSRSATLGCVAALVLAAAPVLPAADGSGGAHAASARSLPRAETAAGVLRQMHIANREQVRLAEMAVERLEPGIRQRYAERLLRDHRFALDRIETLARKLAVELEAPAPRPERKAQPGGGPTHGAPAAGAEAGAQAPAPMQQRLAALADELRSADAASFPAAYIEGMAESHDLMQRAMSTAATLPDLPPELADLIDTMLPIIDQHVRLARGLRSVTAGGAS